MLPVEPGSGQWLQLRTGCFTASRAPALMARTAKGEPTAAYSELIGEVAAERLTGQASTHFVTAAMQRGLDLEAEAADAYAFARDVVLSPSAYVMHPTIERVGATPDRFVGDDGLVEIKCLSVQLKHLDTLIGGKRSIVKDYRDQCLWQMWVTGRRWCDLTSYFPEFPPRQQLAIIRIERDEARFAEFAAAVEQAERDVSAILDMLEQMTPGQREAA